MTVAEALNTVYEKITNVLSVINNSLSDRSIDDAETFYDLPDRINRITGADEVIDGTVKLMTSLAKNVQLYKFYHCTSLTEVSMPVATEIGECAFSECTGLIEAKFPSVTFIGRQAFSDTGLQTVEMPFVISTGGSVFLNCTSLEYAVFPSLNIVEASFFYGCSNLKKVDLTDVRSISANSFTGCPSLEALIIRKDGLCQLQSARAFDNSGIMNGIGFIYVPQAYVSTYISATNWTVFRNKIRPIEAYPDITGYSEN